MISNVLIIYIGQAEGEQSTFGVFSTLVPYRASVINRRILITSTSASRRRYALLDPQRNQLMKVDTNTIFELDSLIQTSLSLLAADQHVRNWRAKERDWVNYFAHRYLLGQCKIDGPIKHAAQIAIEVGVPQPPNYSKPTVGRDLVIWSDIGETCWDADWNPIQHPLAIMEWKVHRPLHRNRGVIKERQWLKAYCEWQPGVVAYAVEVSGDMPGCPITCTRFLGLHEEKLWVDLRCS